MVKTAESTVLDARAELRAWYLGRLRPKLETAVEAGNVEPRAVEALDLLLSDFFEPPEHASEEAA